MISYLTNHCQPALPSDFLKGEPPSHMIKRGGTLGYGCALAILLAASLVSNAQTSINKTFSVQSGQKLSLHFDDPEIKLQTWDKNEVLIKGTVSINHGENDNAFELQANSSAQELNITSLMKDKENIPQRIILKKGDTEYFFKAKDFNDPEVQKFLEQNGRDYSYMSHGIVKEIKLEVFVPKKMETTVRAKYGLVEVKNFDAPLTIEAKYGGVDVTIAAGSIGEITARSRYGEILTNLGIPFNHAQHPDQHNNWTEISAKPGAGPRYSFESKYGNVYLRK